MSKERYSSININFLLMLHKVILRSYLITQKVVMLKDYDKHDIMN